MRRRYSFYDNDVWLIDAYYKSYEPGGAARTQALKFSGSIPLYWSEESNGQLTIDNGEKEN
jgi:hypothetical protein